LIQDGAPGGYIYFITDGLFDVLVRNAFGQELRVAQLGPGQIVGEISWLDRQPYSATIKAAESSSVLALQTSTLDQKIEADTAFASRFFRALAHISSTRLRARSVLFTDPKHLEEERLSPRSSPELGGVLYERLAQFKDLIVAADKGALKSTGSVPDDLRNTLLADFRSLSQELTETMCSQELTSSHRNRIGKMVQRELLPYVHLSSFAERCYSKPRGYAGDYLTIEMMYNNEPSGAGRIGPIVDECMLREPPCQAARNRRHLLSGQINQTIQSTTGRAHIMSLACGPGREIFDALSGSALNAVDVTALDIDQDALNVIKKQSEQQKIPIHALHGNLIYLATGRQQMDLPPQDLIYSIGLIDYFNDGLVIKLIDWIFDCLRPGGRVILGNFHPRNPSRGLMDQVLDWPLIYRDENRMNELYSASKFRMPCTRILFEQQGINLFAECAKN
jgi:extracellular factor (EF) 3-hydroxypalmitic acid methyl ester biosynthesis protein